MTAPPRRNTAHTPQVLWSGDRLLLIVRRPRSVSADCSPGEASRRVAQFEGVIRKARKGREVLISLH